MTDDEIIARLRALYVYETQSAQKDEPAVLSRGPLRETRRSAVGPLALLAASLLVVVAVAVARLSTGFPGTGSSVLPEGGGLQAGSPAAASIWNQSAPADSAAPLPTTSATESCGAISTIYADINRSTTPDPSVQRVVGTVVEVSDAKWATPSGSMPSLQPGRVATPFQVYRTVHVRVSGTGQGSVAADQTIAVRVPGGTIGCRSFVIDGYPSLTPGSSVALFLGHSPSLSAIESNSAWDAVDAWPVTNGQVIDPNGVAISLTTFLDSNR